MKLKVKYNDISTFHDAEGEFVVGRHLSPKIRLRIVRAEAMGAAQKEWRIVDYDTVTVGAQMSYGWYKYSFEYAKRVTLKGEWVPLFYDIVQDEETSKTIIKPSEHNIIYPLLTTRQVWEYLNEHGIMIRVNTAYIK